MKGGREGTRREEAEGMAGNNVVVVVLSSGSEECRDMLGVLHRVVDLLHRQCVSRPSFCSQLLVGLLTVLQEVFHHHR